MKILYVITGLAQGGAERVVCDLADKMYEKGHQIKIAYLIGEILTRPVHNDIEIIKVNLNNVSSVIPAYFKLAKIVKNYQPDVVHSHMVHANLLTRLVRLSSPMTRLICTAHNSNEGGKLRMLAYRSTHKLANISTNVSCEAVQAFENKRAVPKGGMQAIYNGINLKKFSYSVGSKSTIANELGLAHDYQIILAVGRFSEQKDYPNLLKAVSILKQNFEQPFRLVIAGDGELRELIENLIKKFDLVEDVILLGRRDDIANLMSAADLFVLPSAYEGFGLVVAEAMACKCLVVATDSGGVAEVINNDQFLVPPCNSELLAKKIKYALSLDKNTHDEIVLKNLSHVKRSFSLDLIVENWIKLYND